ncbi:MAG: DUF2188 domain-containing protein [Bacilli bacterium]
MHKKTIVNSILGTIFSGVIFTLLIYFKEFFNFMDTIQTKIVSLFDFGPVFEAIKGGAIDLIVIYSVLIISILFFISTIIVVIVKRKPWYIFASFASLIFGCVIAVAVMYAYLPFYENLSIMLGKGTGEVVWMKFSIAAVILVLALILLIIQIVMSIQLFFVRNDNVKNKSKNEGDENNVFNLTPKYNVDTTKAAAPVVEPQPQVNVAPVIQLVKDNKAAVNKPSPEIVEEKKEPIVIQKTVKPVVAPQPVIATPKVEEKPAVAVAPVAPKAVVAPVVAPQKIAEPTNESASGTKRTLTKKEILEQLKNRKKSTDMIEEKKEEAKVAEAAKPTPVEVKPVVKEPAKEVVEVKPVVKEAVVEKPVVKEPVKEVVVEKPAVKEVAEEKPVAIVKPKAPIVKKEETKVEEKKDDVEEKKIINVYHITQVKSTKKWQVKLGNGQRAIKLFDTQAEANEYAKLLSKNNDRGILLHGRNGRIRKE